MWNPTYIGRYVQKRSRSKSSEVRYSPTPGQPFDTQEQLNLSTVVKYEDFRAQISVLLMAGSRVLPRTLT